MKLYYDKEVDALYIEFSEKPYSYTEEVDCLRHIDYASDGTPIGIEILLASKGMKLNGLPYSAEIEKIIKKDKNLAFA